MELQPLPQTRLRPVGEALYELPRDAAAGMRVPLRLVASTELLAQIGRDRSLAQLLNVSTLPGISGYALGMPDMHEGYGFPVGGVAGMRYPEGVVSPGGIGFDINCGVRLLSTGLEYAPLAEQVRELTHELSRSIPAGFGRAGRLALERDELDRVLAEGCPFLVQALGLGRLEDLGCIESGGRLPGADPGQVSERAKQRGLDQLGTLGGGNHFLELQVVDAVYDAHAAAALGLAEGQLTVLIHTGSRGLGHQVCTDYVQAMDALLPGFGITLPDRQLACAPLGSEIGREYLAAMGAAANFAWCNRQLLTHRVREAFARKLGGPAAEGVRVVYDVAHNIAKLERHGGELLCVHRKGATRAFGPSSPELPEAYRGLGQPVFIPGSMGTASFVLLGTDAASAISLSSCCHGAGRALSRHEAKRQRPGHEVRQELESRGIAVSCPSNAELAEEAPGAYKDVEAVVAAVVSAGIARQVARLRPRGVLKG